MVKLKKFSISETNVQTMLHGSRFSGPSNDLQYFVEEILLKNKANRDIISLPILLLFYVLWNRWKKINPLNIPDSNAMSN